jgi:hypothetical protein
VVRYTFHSFTLGSGRLCGPQNLSGHGGEEKRKILDSEGNQTRSYSPQLTELPRMVRNIRQGYKTAVSFICVCNCVQLVFCDPQITVFEGHFDFYIKSHSAGFFLSFCYGKLTIFFSCLFFHCSSSLHELGPEACSDSELGSETKNALRNFGGIL